MEEIIEVETLPHRDGYSQKVDFEAPFKVVVTKRDERDDIKRQNKQNHQASYPLEATGK